MKKTVILMLAFALPVFAANNIDTDIDTSHRGYGLQKPAPVIETVQPQPQPKPQPKEPEPRKESKTPVNAGELNDYSGIIIFMGTGVFFPDDVIYQNTAFMRKTAPAVQIGLQCDITKHFSAGLSISHVGGSTATVDDFKNAGDIYRLDFRMTSFTAMAGFRWPVSILEPYLNLGFMYNLATLEEIEVSNSNERQDRLNSEFTGGLAELGLGVWLTDYLKLSISCQYMYLDYAAFERGAMRAFLTANYKF